MWYAIWSAWLAAFCASFAILEGMAIVHRGLTLSMFTWKLTEAWGPLPFFLGLLAGGLAVHFWWHWLPPGAVNVG